MLISLHLGFEDLFVFNCRNQRIVRTSVLLAFAAQIRAAASPVEPRADERERTEEPLNSLQQTAARLLRVSVGEGVFIPL